MSQTTPHRYATNVSPFTYFAHSDCLFVFFVLRDHVRQFSFHPPCPKDKKAVVSIRERRMNDAH